MYAIQLDYRSQPAGYLGSKSLGLELVPTAGTARKFSLLADARQYLESRPWLPYTASVVALPTTPEESSRPQCI